MKVEGRWRRTIEVDDRGTVIVLDQSRLPYDIAWLPLKTLDDAAAAIRDMKIRGAPLIGATAAYGVAIALRHDPDSLDHACTVLAQTRPTAINLRWALDEMRRRLAHCARSARGEVAMVEAAKVSDEDVAACEAIGMHGLELIRRVGSPGKPVNVLTHCNAGWLATVDWGTALAPVYKAFEAGIDVHVWVEETRPRNQGLLTAWELNQHGVAHTVIADNSGGHLMQQGQVDVCIVGTDRTTRNGDVCNKIGTYLKALAAHDNGVPFYAGVPSSSIDFTVGEPHEIPIEERSGDEVRYMVGRGPDGTTTRIAILDPSTRVANPAFDVTPRKYMTGLITERGTSAASAEGLASLFPERVR
jgi:methylthioribose-1-phosphate isomerase